MLPAAWASQTTATDVGAGPGGAGYIEESKSQNVNA